MPRIKKKDLLDRVMELEANYRSLEDRVLKLDNPTSWNARHTMKNISEKIEREMFGLGAWLAEHDKGSK